jgi:hypothetical protein
MSMDSDNMHHPSNLPSRKQLPFGVIEKRGVKLYAGSPPPVIGVTHLSNREEYYNN